MKKGKMQGEEVTFLTLIEKIRNLEGRIYLLECSVKSLEAANGPIGTA